MIRRFSRKFRRTTKQTLLVALICIFVIGGAAMGTVFIIMGQMKDKYMVLLATANQEIVDNQRSIYIAMSNIHTGDFITKENVAIQTVFTEQPDGVYISEADLGKVARVDLIAGTQILKTMLSENTVGDEIREIEYSVINISSNIANQDSVDVRITYPNGESYIVLSKKLIRGYVPETATCNLWMDEEEQLRMSAAIVDAALYAGSSIYVTKYIEPNIQEASIVNYTPSLSILSLLRQDPNLLARASIELSEEVRKALENRLANSMELDISQVQWEVNPATYQLLEEGEATEETREDATEETKEEAKEETREETKKETTKEVREQLTKEQNKGNNRYNKGSSEISREDLRVDPTEVPENDNTELQDQSELGSSQGGKDELCYVAGHGEQEDEKISKNELNLEDINNPDNEELDSSYFMVGG